MAESLQHQRLVERVVKAVAVTLSDCNEAICLVDGTTDSDGIPRRIGGFRPDVYAADTSIVIVGEAKTAKDLESPRTEHQLRAFLKYVEAHTSRHLVLAVPWTAVTTAKSVLRHAAPNWSSVCSRVHILDGIYPLTIPEEESNSAPGS